MIRNFLCNLFLLYQDGLWKTTFEDTFLSTTIKRIYGEKLGRLNEGRRIRLHEREEPRKEQGEKESETDANIETEEDFRLLR